jgi:hypothetical protein
MSSLIEGTASAPNSVPEFRANFLRRKFGGILFRWFGAGAVSISLYVVLTASKLPLLFQNFIAYNLCFTL